MSYSEIAFFAKTNFRNQERPFGIKTDDRRRHMYLIGKTGMGKTNLLENLVIQDIQKGHGVAYIDPHGDTAEKLLKAIPADRINDVIYFNPSDQDFPIAFNVMEKVSEEYRHLVSSGLIGVFKKIWADSWGPRLEYILRNAILALLEYPGSTLLGVTRILVDKSYRERVVEKITDPVIRSFWVDEFPKWSDRVLQEVISPIQNKVGQFLSSSLIRNIVGQTISSFDIREIMDGKKILIMNLSKGRIGEDNSALLGAMMITKIQLAAMGRVDIPEETRNDFYLYVDEFQNFATESFANILSEARKYHLNLILANQYVEQIDEKVRNAIFGNAGTIVAFRVGAMDAEFLEKEFEPVFMLNDLVNLPKYHIYLKLMIDGISGDAFSAVTLPPIAIHATEENEEKVIRLSRERYTNSRAEVEDKIRRWSGMLTEEEKRTLLEKNRPTLSAKATMEESKPSATSTTTPGASAPPRRIPPSPASPSRTVSKRESLPTSSSLGTADTASQSEKKQGISGEGSITPTMSVSEERSVVVPALEGMTVPAVEEAMAPMAPVKVMYPTTCDTCGTDIEVPFKPDGKRPTFCRDCLRDYQRATAKVRDTADRRNRTVPVPNGGGAQAPLQKKVESVAFVSTDRPMTLSQVTNMEPRKLKTLRSRPAVNLQDVRSMIESMRDGGGGDQSDEAS